MPNDVYRWEEGGGLVHHCPICQTPLTHAMCRSQCLGHHVEWCSRYHTQLFRKGWSSQCAPCRHSDEQHEKRHREIAELLRQLKEVNQEPLAPVAGIRTQHVSTPSPLSKKERKAVKKAAKLADMPKVITTVDVEFVARQLHPHDHEQDEAEEEKRLLEDPDIKLNLYYNKSTSNTREVRHRHLAHKQEARDELDISDEELDALLLGLKVPPSSQVKKAAERKLIEAVRKAVRHDMLNVAKEHEQTGMRKAGFWRWASKKAYNRLVQNGRIWEQKSEAADVTDRRDSVVSGPEEVDGKEKAGTASMGKAHKAEKENAPPKTPVSKLSRDRTTSSSVGATVDDGWTQVGKVKALSSGNLTIKMSGNGGLGKLLVKPKGMFGALGPAGLGYAAARDESDEE